MPARHAIVLIAALSTLGLNQAACCIEGTNTEGRAGAPQPLPMVRSDADIAAIVSTGNKGEIETSQLALAKAQSSAVLEFANFMISAHSRAEQRQSVLFRQLGIVPQQNPVSAALYVEGATMATSLREGPLKSFDRAYMYVQVTLHRRVLDLLDTQLIQRASAPVLRAELQKARSEVAEHLAMAEQILASL